MVDPATAQGGLGYTGTHPFEKGKRPVQRIFMFFSRLMGYLFNVRVAPFAFYFGMHNIVKYGFVYKQEPEFTFFIQPAETGVFVAHQAVADISGVRTARQKEKKQHA